MQSKLRCLWVLALVLVPLFLCPASGKAPAMAAPGEALQLSISTAVSSSPRYGEAPALSAMAATGHLPAVQSRLPTHPKVLHPVDGIGKYGGTWRTSLVGDADGPWIQRTIGYENLVCWTPDWSGVEPNVAESYTVNHDATQFTFRLRDGMRWSDGEPFTADDILFWYEDVLSHPDLWLGAPNWMVVNGETGTVTTTGSLTVTFSFTAPNGLFLYGLASPSGLNTSGLPKHYLEQFHIAYNPDANQVAQALGFLDWTELMMYKIGDYYADTNRPVLWAWKLTTPYVPGGSDVIAERNPYYWKVDTAGNQLPYLDRVIYRRFSDTETLVQEALAGKIDMQNRHIATIANRQAFFDNQAAGGYRLFDTVPSDMNAAIISLNLTHEDPDLEQVFQDKDFRIALSHAISRTAIIDSVYLGFGSPYQAAPRPESSLYTETLALQYTRYDPALANQMLDNAGYATRDGQGYRLGPGGNRISFQVDVVSWNTEGVSVVQAVSNDWKGVGIEMQANPISRTLLYERKTENLHDAVVWSGEGSNSFAMYTDPRYFFPFSNESNFAIPWALWFMDPADPLAETPPAAAQQQMDLYNQLKATADAAEQEALMAQILDIAAQEFWAIGISLPELGYGIVNENMRNVPALMPGAWIYPTPGPTNPPLYYYEAPGSVPFDLDVTVAPAASNRLRVSIQSTATLTTTPGVQVFQWGATSPLTLPVTYAGSGLYTGSLFLDGSATPSLDPSLPQEGNIRVKAEDTAGNTRVVFQAFSCYTVTASAHTQIEADAGNLSLDLPANTLSQDTVLVIAPVDAPGDPPADNGFLSTVYTIQGQEGVTFTGSAELTFNYLSLDEGSMGASRVRFDKAKVCRWDGASGQWAPLPTSTLSADNRLSAQISDFGIYAAVGEPRRYVYLPTVMR